MGKGSCLCGNFKFEYQGKPFRFSLCHCKMCQKFSGAPFGAFIAIKSENFKVLSGEEFEKYYESSEWAKRTFCSNCGSSLRYVFNDSLEDIYISGGLVDGEIGIRPEVHIFYKDKCLWYTPKDELPKLDKM